MNDKEYGMQTDPENMRINKWQTLLLCLVCVIFAFGGAMLGSGVLTCISGVIFAFLMCLSDTYLVFICAPASYLAVLAATGDPAGALAALLFLLVGIALFICVKKAFGLSVTVTVLSFAALLSVGTITCMSVMNAYGDLVGGFKAMASEMSGFLDSALEILREVTTEENVAIFNEQAISELRESMIMTAPAVIVLSVELLAYVLAKIFLLLTLIFKKRELLPRTWELKAKLPTMLLFVACYIVCMLSPSTEIIYYSAANLMFIIMPFAAITGFHAVFGKDGTFRAAKKSSYKILTVVLCCVFFFMSPVMLFTALGFWGAIDAVRRIMIEKIKEKKDKDGTDL